MINFLNSENHIQEIQALQQASSNQIIISTSEEVGNLADAIKDLARNVLINRIQTATANNKDIFIGQNIDIYV